MIKNLFLVSFLFVQSCSVYLAADGTPEPNTSGFHNGMTRFQVESVLGGPFDFTQKKDGSVAIYRFTKGDAPSPGRAGVWLALDIILATLPELLLTPYELNKGEIKRIKVHYNEDDIVTQLDI